jgi:hypothetical protein
MVYPILIALSFPINYLLVSPNDEWPISDAGYFLYLIPALITILAYLPSVAIVIPFLELKNKLYEFSMTPWYRCVNTCHRLVVTSLIFTSRMILNNKLNLYNIFRLIGHIVFLVLIYRLPSYTKQVPYRQQILNRLRDSLGLGVIIQSVLLLALNIAHSFFRSEEIEVLFRQVGATILTVVGSAVIVVAAVRYGVLRYAIWCDCQKPLVSSTASEGDGSLRPAFHPPTITIVPMDPLNHNPQDKGKKIAASAS